MADEPIRVCGVPDFLGTGQVCKWPDGDIGWGATALPPGVTEEQFTACAMWALNEIARHCGIRPRLVQSMADRPRILSGVRAIDGPMGVLAESELPCGNVTLCRQWYDTGEHWSVELLAIRSGNIPLWLVMLHELMHALGLPHAPDGVKAVMAPMLDTTLRECQPWDIQQLQLRYGPPVTQPPVMPPVPTPIPTPVPIPTPSPVPGGFMGNLASLLALLAKLGPLLALLQDPKFMQFIDLLLNTFAGKSAVTFEEVAQAAPGVVEQLRA